MVPRSAQWDRVVPGRGGADIGVPLNYSTTIEIPLKQKGWGTEDSLWRRGVPSGTE